MIRFAWMFALSLAVGTAACNNDPAKGKTKAIAGPAESPEPDRAEPEAEEPAATVTYVFDQEGSKLSWVGAKITRKHDGGFEKFNGKVEVVDGDPTKSTVETNIDLTSVTSDEEKLTTHLKSPDFFEVEKFPTAKFTSTNIVAGGEGESTHTVTGNLDLHGVTKSLTFPATIKVEGDTASVDAEFVIDRKDFEITYPGMPDDLIKDDVLIKLEIRAKKA